MLDERQCHICPGCDGDGWVENGFADQPIGRPTYDVLMFAYRACAQCAGQRYYVSRAEAGLATAP